MYDLLYAKSHINARRKKQIIKFIFYFFINYISHIIFDIYINKLVKNFSFLIKITKKIIF